MLLLNAAENDQLLDAPIQHDCTVYLTRSCNHNCDNLGHMKSVEELWTFEAPSGSSAVVDFNAVLSQTLPGMACFRGISQFSCIPHTSRHLAVIFISLHTCTGCFNCEEVCPVAGVKSVAALSLYCLYKQEIICNQ